ncbi:MAG: hypothetical protein Q9162_006246 [Coniocarpon cinnabarinum]
MADSKLDLDETNRMRAALGMAPLPSNSSSDQGLNFRKTTQSADESDASSDEDEEEASTHATRLAAASSNWHKLNDEQQARKRKEERRAKLKKERDAAQRYSKLEGKGLGEDDENELDTRAWLLGKKKREGRIEEERQRQLEEARLEQEREAQRSYTEKDLAGVKVGHEIDEFDDGGEQILTLKDANVEAESDEGDELENAQMRDAEKRRERLELKKRKPDYDPNSEGGNGVLSKYDEEIQGKKKDQFTLNGSGAPAGVRSLAAVEELAPGRTKISLDFMDDFKPAASDYQEPKEIKIKKTKHKKGKTKQRRRTDDDDDIFPAQSESAPAPPVDSMDLDEGKTNGSLAPKRKADSSFIDDDDLQSHLAQQRSAALKKRKRARPEDLARQVREEDAEASNAMKTEEDGVLVFDETSRFVGALEADNEEESRLKRPATKAESPAIKPEPVHSPPAVDNDNDNDTAMPDSSAVKSSHSPTPDPSAPAQSSTGLEEEASLSSLGATLNMLQGRGILKSANSGDINAHHRERQRFLAEKSKREESAAVAAQLARARDRESGKFSKMSARERDAYAAQQNNMRDQQDSRQAAEVFNREYRPSVELKYTDEFGRSMNEKEAFKHLSHMFHGKGSGKMKTEKKLKKVEEEGKRESARVLEGDRMAEGGLERAMEQQQMKRGMAGVRMS